MRLPDTWLSKEAYAIINVVAVPELINHSIRTYLLARVYAQKKNIDFEDERLYLAALFHDLGLCPAYKNHLQPFQINSSRALQNFLDEHQVSPECIRILVDAIDFHMQLLPKWSKGNIAGLLQIGAWMDIARLRSWTIKDQVHAIETEYPRLQIERKFPKLLLSSIGSAHSCWGLLFPRGVTQRFSV